MISTGHETSVEEQSGNYINVQIRIAQFYVLLVMYTFSIGPK